jgi:hypothetical protein
LAFIELEEFKSKIKDVARSNRFRLEFLGLEHIGLNSDTDISYYVKSVNLPSLSIPEISIHKFGSIIPVASDHTFNQLSVTFLNDYHLKIRKLMERWFKAIHNYPDTKKDEYFQYSKIHAILYHLGRQGEITAGWKYFNIVPVQLGDVSLDMDSGDKETFTVDFKYLYFEDII